MADDARIPLARAIEDLRSELLRAVASGKGQALQFRLKPIELELKLAVTREAEANGGVKFWVLDIGAKGSIGDAETHTLRLVLEPVGKDGRSEFLVSEVGVPEPG